MSTKKININQLTVGMFVHELDISWIDRPFLRHRRKISDKQDIDLLIKAGVKELYIDLDRGIDVPPKKSSPSLSHGLKADAIVLQSKAKPEDNNTKSEVKKNLSTPPKKESSLTEELQIAKQIQGKIGELVNEMSNLVKDGKPLSAEAISPVITEARESIDRNDQALLTMLHLYRKDIKLSDHSFGVFSIVLPLALRLGRSEQEIEELGMAALLHDTGWSRLPMHLVGKHKPYTEAELRLISQHPTIIENVLDKSDNFPENVKLLVKQHHEMFDGSGYPKQLKKSQLHPLLDILQVADSYDETVHGLTDKPGMLPANALKILYQSSKKGFYSETVVSALIHVMGLYPLTSAVSLNTGEKALVIEIDKQKPLLPKIKIVYQADDSESPPDIVVDLANQKGEIERKVIDVIDPLNENNDPLGLLRVMEV